MRGVNKVNSPFIAGEKHHLSKKRKNKPKQSRAQFEQKEFQFQLIQDLRLGSHSS